MFAVLVFCEMLSQYPQSAFQGLSGVTKGGQQHFAAQALRIHLLGIEERTLRSDMNTDRQKLL